MIKKGKKKGEQKWVCRNLRRIRVLGMKQEIEFLPPMRHTCVAVFLEGFLKTSDSFFVVEGVRPDQASVEPCLGLVAGGADLALEIA